ncbi:hypothetical protein ABIB25_004792 [Nakamurella sp. UYEF19]
MIRKIGDFNDVTVTAVVQDRMLPGDDPRELVTLG